LKTYAPPAPLCFAEPSGGKEQSSHLVIVKAAIVATIIASQGMVPLEPLYDTNEWQFN
jgi:hypothetical protein